MKNNCPFCAISIQESAYASENGFLSLYNHSPILPGHSLVIPIRHANSLFELSEEEISAFFSFARKVTAFLTQTYASDAYDWSLQEGEAAGQSVEHLHLHIIPRNPGDLPEGEDWYVQLEEQRKMPVDAPERKILNSLEYKGICDSLREKWNSQ
ncbi:MAG: HIT domain-containing protein [Lentimicrobium sp.]|jgi:bis(5'-adenosyl)-triphosphatase|nr:HIT domain-containing protein [Lentimicrobium sp.]